MSRSSSFPFPYCGDHSGYDCDKEKELCLTHKEHDCYDLDEPNFCYDPYKGIDTPITTIGDLSKDIKDAFIKQLLKEIE